MNAQNSPMKKTFFDFDDNDIQQDDNDMGPWCSNPRKIYPALVSKRQKQVKQGKEQKQRYQQKKPKELFNIRYKRPLQTKSLDLKEHKTKTKTIQMQRNQRVILNQRMLSTHRNKKQTHLPIITARQEYGDIFKYTKPQPQKSKFDDDEFVIHDELRNHRFKKKQKNKHIHQKKQKQHYKLLNNIETLIGKQTPLFNIYQKCIVQVRKRSIKERVSLRNSLRYV